MQKSIVPVMFNCSNADSTCILSDTPSGIVSYIVLVTDSCNTLLESIKGEKKTVVGQSWVGNSMLKVPGRAPKLAEPTFLVSAAPHVFVKPSAGLEEAF